MNKLFICIGAVFLFLAGFYSCDSTTAPDEILKDMPVLNSFRVLPASINFNPEDGFTDTTVVFTIEATIPINGTELSNPYAVISNKNSGKMLAEIDLNYLDSRTGLYAADFEILTTTTSFEEYIVNLIYDEEKGSYARSKVNVNGFPNDPPQILEADNPEQVQIPSEGAINFLFTAKVIDPDGQENIEGVYVEFVNKDGTRLIPNPNKLLDDGDSSINGSGDIIAGDSVYTIGFSVNSGNTPNNRTVQYFAIDKAGLSSDTVETIFNIVE